MAMPSRYVDVQIWGLGRSQVFELQSIIEGEGVEDHQQETSAETWTYTCTELEEEERASKRQRNLAKEARGESGEIYLRRQD